MVEDVLHQFRFQDLLDEIPGDVDTPVDLHHLVVQQHLRSLGDGVIDVSQDVGILARAIACRGPLAEQQRGVHERRYGLSDGQTPVARDGAEQRHPGVPGRYVPEQPVAQFRRPPTEIMVGGRFHRHQNHAGEITEDAGDVGDFGITIVRGDVDADRIPPRPQRQARRIAGEKQCGHAAVGGAGPFPQQCGFRSGECVRQATHPRHIHVRGRTA